MNECIHISRNRNTIYVSIRSIQQRIRQCQVLLKLIIHFLRWLTTPAGGKPGDSRIQNVCRETDQSGFCRQQNRWRSGSVKMPAQRYLFKYLVIEQGCSNVHSGKMDIDRYINQMDDDVK